MLSWVCLVRFICLNMIMDEVKKSGWFQLQNCFQDHDSLLIPFYGSMYEL